MRNTTCASVLLITVAFSVTTYAADGTLAAARDLYVSASYDDALAMLSGLSNGSPALEERQSIDLYRTLCLFALGRGSDADRVIDAMLTREPLYHASNEELSPRVRSAFESARKRILPGVIQKTYADAKAAFDKENFAVASAGFADVLKSIADPDITSLVGAPPLSDIRTLATSFRDLSAKLIPPPPAPKEIPKPARPLKPFYTPEDRDVAAPTVVQQKVPRYPAAVTRPLSGVLEFVIDETGAVLAPTMIVSIDPTYDQMVVSSAKRWTYQPAMLDGKPVKYMKRLTISVAVAPVQ
jgi:hypothetical protein